MDEMFARLNRIYPNSGYVRIPRYNPQQWETREYDSKFDTKGPLTKWKTQPLSYEEAEQLVENGERVGWIVPKGMVVVDIDNADDARSQEKLESLLQKWEVNYSYNYTSRGMHILFIDPTEMVTSDSHCKCALNIDIDTRANKTGYIILPCNDPHRRWGKWNDYVEPLPYFLRPLMKDSTPSFIGLQDGDGRNNALFKWRTKLECTKKLTAEEIEKSIRIINEFLFSQPMPNNELFKTVLREKVDVEDPGKLSKTNIHNELAEKLLGRYDLIYYGNTFYKFTGSYYKKIPDNEVEHIIHFELSKNLSRNARREITEFLKIKARVQDDDMNKDWHKIAVENGILNLVTGELETPNKTDYNTIFVPWRYENNPEASPRIMQFMKEIANGDIIKINFLYQVAGYTLLKRNMFEKFFMFQGEGQTGKSTYLNLLEKLVGVDNTSHTGLVDMDRDYYLAEMVNKLLNIDDDVVDGRALENTGRFKSIVSGNKVTVRQIYKDPMVYKPFATCCFSCNKLPKIMDRTSGLYRRIVLIELNHKVENPDPTFMLKITNTDMEYFLFKAVEGIRKVIEEGHFAINQSEQDLLRIFKCRQSPLNEWLYEMDITTGDLVNKPCLSMYGQFQEWAQTNGHARPMTATSFRDDVCALYDLETSFIIVDGQKSNKLQFIKIGDYDAKFKPF